MGAVKSNLVKRTKSAKTLIFAVLNFNYLVNLAMAKVVDKDFYSHVSERILQRSITTVLSRDVGGAEHLVVRLVDTVKAIDTKFRVFLHKKLTIQKRGQGRPKY